MLTADRLTFGYGPGLPVLNDWTCSFKAGEVTAVTGPSGRGKSTLLYLLGLTLRPLSGKINFDGSDVATLSDQARARLRATTFGFVFQDAVLDATRTVLDNVIETALYRNQPRSSATRAAHELLERFGVNLRADAKPGQVSGGQAQRIALCRALLNNPRILLADEPTGNLDVASAGVVLDAFHERAAQGAAVVVVTHDLGLVSQCDREVTL